MSLTEQHSLSAIRMFLLGIFIFTDFTVTDYCIRLFARSSIRKDLIDFLLDQLNEITSLEFYLTVKDKNNEVMDLYCLSDPLFFSKLFQLVNTDNEKSILRKY
ncbi:MAG: hypothetical protein ACFFFG_01885 [Candidatus Thorarchaeota archaeon]